jgi:hypothetical protein
MKDMWKNLKIIQKFGKEKPQSQDSVEGYGLEYVHHWVNDLAFQLNRFDSDSEFRMDLLESAGKHFINALSDNEKQDAFLYILGALAREQAKNNDL